MLEHRFNAKVKAFIKEISGIPHCHLPVGGKHPEELCLFFFNTDQDSSATCVFNEAGRCSNHWVNSYPQVLCKTGSVSIERDV